MDNEQLLCDINELNHLFRDSVSIETLLDEAVEMVAARTRSGVCSIYLYDAETRELTLRATQGLNPESVGTVRLKLGQGLTGLALEQMQTVCENDASRNPSYKYFPGIFEERYNAFLAVPIARGVAKMGVLVLQRDSDECFNDIDITALETVASQLAHIIENAQFLLGMHEPKKETARALPQKLRVVRGKVGSEGFAYAPAEIIDKQRSLSFLLQQDFDGHYTLEHFHEAMAHTARQLEALQERVEHKLSSEEVRAVVLVGGGVTSHISILARSLGMPLVIASSIELLDVPDGTPILVDAEIGNVYIDPDDEVLSKFSSQQRVRHSLAEQKAQIKPETLTADGTQVRLMANINLLTDLKLAAELKIGMMVELPSVAELMDDFAREADFFSIGTNDLVQFMLGVDRTNESVAELYLPHHPSVLRTLDRIVRSATERGRDVSVCGDMAHGPRYIPFLLGIGVRTLSVDPAYLLRTQQTVGRTSLSDARELAREALAQSRVSDIAALLETAHTPEPAETTD